jgi:hypothetical protein
MKRTNVLSIVVAILAIAIAIAFAACSPSGGDDAGDGSRGAFVSTWKTDNPGLSESNQITLPLVERGVYECVVDWGDGTMSEITAYDDADKTHTYATAGTYTVSITGMIQGFRFAAQPLVYYDQNGDSNKLLSVDRWGVLNLGGGGDISRAASTYDRGNRRSRFDRGFRPVVNVFPVLSIIKDTECITVGVSQVTNMRNMFKYAKIFNDDIGCWDVSNVTYMDEMFYEASAFNKNLGSWNVSKASGIDYIFSDSGVSNENYSAFLIGISALPMLTRNVNFHSTGKKYSAAAAPARAKIIAEYGWYIYEHGQE